MSNPILVQLDQDALFWLETDASRYATGEVLSQLCDNNKWHPIGFTSVRVFSQRSKSYLAMGVIAIV